MKLSQVNLDGTGVTAGGMANLISASPHLISIRANNTRPLPAEQQSDDDDDGGTDEVQPLHWDSSDQAVYAHVHTRAHTLLVLHFNTS